MVEGKAPSERPAVKGWWVVFTRGRHRGWWDRFAAKGGPTHVFLLGWHAESMRWVVVDAGSRGLNAGPLTDAQALRTFEWCRHLALQVLYVPVLDNRGRDVAASPMFWPWTPYNCVTVVCQALGRRRPRGVVTVSQLRRWLRNAEGTEVGTWHREAAT